MTSSSRAILVFGTTCIPVCCSAFRQQTISTPPIRSPRWDEDSSCIHSATRSSCADKSICDDSIRLWDNGDALEYQGEQNDAGVELWLDLRGTSLTPKAALELWNLDEHQSNQQQQSEDGDIANSLTRPPFVKCIVSSNAKDTNENGQNKIDVLHVAENDVDGMKFLLRKKNQSTSSIGRILSLQTSSSSLPILPDPLPLMEIASKGQWVILDTNEWNKVSEEDWQGMVLPLVQMISSGASSSSTCGGGVGLTCCTNNEIVKSAMFIQSMSNNGGGIGRGKMCYKTLESGIVILDDAAATNPSGGDIQISDRRTNFALVVPYDMGLLQTAKLLLGCT